MGDSSIEPAVATHFVDGRVEDEIGDGEAVRRGLASGATQDRGDTQHEFVDAERLGQVVVAAVDEALDPVVGCVACGQEEHRRDRARRPQLAADLVSVDAGEHDVEHDQVEVAGSGEVVPRRPSSAVVIAWP